MERDLRRPLMVPRIGIDKDIIDWLQQNGYPEIRLEDVEESYTPRIIPDDEYLRKKRIELDSIIAAFPDTPGRGPEALWKYIKYKIEKLQKEKGFDYSNIITRPEPKEFYPESLNTFLSLFDEYVEKVTKEDWRFENEKLVGTKELKQVEERKEQNLAVLEDALDNDDVMQDEIIPRIDTMIDELEEWFESKDMLGAKTRLKRLTPSLTTLHHPIDWKKIEMNNWAQPFR